MKHNHENIKTLLLKHGFDGDIEHLFQDVKGTTWVTSQVIEKCVRDMHIEALPFGLTKPALQELACKLGLGANNNEFVDDIFELSRSVSFNEAGALELCSYIAIKYFTLDEDHN